MVDASGIERLAAELEKIRHRAIELESTYADQLAKVDPVYADGARNLVHYLALRESDLEDLQQQLAALGLSSLGRAERNVLGSITAVLRVLASLAGKSEKPDQGIEILDFRNPDADAHKRAILGDPPDDRDVSIMVTLPSEAATNRKLVDEMIAAGMNVARINCAHDDADAWADMVRNVREASDEAGVGCRIVMDLAGPKLRTGELAPGPGVLHIRPRRDPLGRVIAPRRVRLIPDDTIQRGTKSALIPVPRECIELADQGDEIRIRDTRGKKRRFGVVTKDDKGLVLECYQGAYIATGTKLRLCRTAVHERLHWRIGELPAVELPLLLRAGDTLMLHREATPGEPAVEDADGNVTIPAHIACQQPEVFRYLSPGDPVSLNDGKIGGVIRDVSEDRVDIEITKAKPAGSRLRGNRGINFPRSDIRLPGITESDCANLEFIARHADAVSLSFARKPSDVAALRKKLARLPNADLGVIVKIETRRGFRNLPRLILAAMQNHPAAIMIARGDLAVECGWVRLAELQEEILWLCEAARLPVIWATQVLEQEARRGMPSRAEITDAAMSQRADCVMLNKGPHILAAIRMLDDILRRMQTLQIKKTSRIRKLRLSVD